MKRTRHFIFFLCMITSLVAKSQLEPGDRLIGGAVNVYSSSYAYTYSNNPTNNVNSFGSGFVPRYSWVRKNNRMNGVFLNANYSHSKTTGTPNPSEFSKSDYLSLGLGYFIRKYNDFNQQLGWFLEYNGVGSYSINKHEQNYFGSNANSRSAAIAVGVNVSPGLYYKASRAVLVEAAFGGVNASYSRSKGAGTKSSGFNIGLNFPSNFSFGLQFFLPRKESIK